MPSGFLPAGRGIGPRAIGKCGFSPTRIANLAMWLDASAINGLGDGDAISEWMDGSGNGRNVAAAGAATLKPVYKTGILNGNPVARFDGGDFLAAAAAVLINSIFSIFVVSSSASAQVNKVLLAQHTGAADVNRVTFIATDTTTGEFLRLFYNDGVSRTFVSTTVAFGKNSVAYCHSNGAGLSHVRVNGGSAEAEVTLSAWAPLNTVLSVGALGNGSNGFTGDIAEIIIYSATLADADRQAVEAYLIEKWGIA